MEAGASAPGGSPERGSEALEGLATPWDRIRSGIGSGIGEGTFKDPSSSQERTPWTKRFILLRLQTIPALEHFRKMPTPCENTGELYFCSVISPKTAGKSPQETHG